MRLRRLRGGTLLIIITGVLVMVLLGASIAMLVQVMGVSREAAGSLDASVLSIARLASQHPTVNVLDVGAPEFAGLGQGGSNEISIATYNKAVSKTILVALNAEEENTDEAFAHAKLLEKQLDILAAALRRKLSDSKQLSDAFDEMSASNILRMAGGKRIERVGQIKSACFGQGEPSDIYFDPESLPAGAMTKLEPFLCQEGKKAPNGQSYLKGYQEIALAGIKIQAVPVFPGEQPHLISLSEFQKSASRQPGATIPNAFMVSSTAGGLTNHVAAVIGVVNNVMNVVTGPGIRPVPSPVADIPGGYIRFVNLPGVQLENNGGEIVYDGENDLFNKELFSPSRVVQSTNGVFTTDTAQMDAWIAYNKGQGGDPRTRGFDPAKMRSGSGPGQSATGQELSGVNELLCECTHTMYTGELTGPCIDPANVKSWAKNYQRASMSIPRPQDDLCAVEAAKLEVLELRAKFSRSFGSPEFSSGSKDSGVKLFDSRKSYSCPPEPVNFAKVGTPWELIAQIRNESVPASHGFLPEAPMKIKLPNGQVKTYGAEVIGGEEFFGLLCTRIRVLRPGTTDAEIEQVLGSRKLPLGKTLFLRKSGENLVFDEQGPSSNGDGQPVKAYRMLTVSGCIVNTKGDAGFADAPFSFDGVRDAMSSGDKWMYSVERMVFAPGTGQGNCLGEVRFENKVSSHNFCCPN